MDESSYSTGYKNAMDETLNPIASTEPKITDSDVKNSIVEINNIDEKKDSSHFVDRAADLFEQQEAQE